MIIYRKENLLLLPKWSVPHMKHRCFCVLIIANVLQHFVIDAWVKGLLLTFSSIRISSKSLSIFPDSISGRDISPSILRSEKKLSSREQGAEIRKLLQSPEHEWMHATVHSVSPFGLFVRPAGFSIIGKNLWIFCTLCLLIILNTVISLFWLLCDCCRVIT